MSDYGHEQTDKELKRIEKLISKEYNQAAKELEEKMKKHLAKFEKKDVLMKKKLDTGQITEEEYKNWRIGQIAIGERWKEARDSMTNTLVNTDKTAAAIIQGNSIKAYGDNMNYGTYEVEHGAKINTGFSLYDENTVKNLLKEDPKLIPMPKVDIPKDKLWNRQKLTSAVTQGILQGESIPGIVKRLASVADMDKKAAIRNARTYTTAAENKGRVDSYERAKDLGIKVKKKWIATLDDRTRVEHRHLDNMVVDNDAEFETDGYKISYPGDPSADPEMIYNCRCTLVAEVEGVKYNDERNDSKLGDMTYEEWKYAKDREDKAEKETNKELHTTNMQSYEQLKNTVKANNIVELEVKELDKELTNEEIINKLAGGDMTKGSCASLSFAYAGNECGLDVTDFRGGYSQEVFSHKHNIEKLFEVANADVQTFTVKKQVKETAEIIKNIEKDKEFILVAGKHAAIIRNSSEFGLQYLELQSNTQNGWRNFAVHSDIDYRLSSTVEQTLQRRFGCRKTEDKVNIGGEKITMEKKVHLAEVKSFKPTKEFKEMLGYINTEEGKQKKGSEGGIR